MKLSAEYSDTFPSTWEFITEQFLDLVELDVEEGRMPGVYGIQFLVRHGLCFISYRGGNEVTDAYARFARELSGKVCGNCGASRDAEASVISSLLQCERCI